MCVIIVSHFVSPYFGSESFVDRIKRKYLLEKVADKREQPSLVSMQRSFFSSEIVTMVASELAVDEQSLLVRRSSERDARLIAIYCVCRFWRSAETLTDLARLFSVSSSGLTRARDTKSIA